MAYQLLGYHEPLLHHALNLLLHTANGFLVGWLAWHLWGKDTAVSRTLRSFAAAALFLLFPFSYQAAPWVGALNHELALALILGSLAAFWRMGRAGGRRRLLWGGAGWLLALLAPFAHENGVLVGPLLALMLWTTPQREAPVRKRPFWIALWTLPALIWLPIWWSVPKPGSELHLNGLEGMMQSGVYFLQGVGYPLTWLGGWLAARTGWIDLWVAAGLGGTAVLLALWGQRRGGLSRRALLPWGWIALTLAPSLLFLRFNYVINGPRLLLPAGAGIAWLWGTAVAGFVRSKNEPQRSLREEEIRETPPGSRRPLQWITAGQTSFGKALNLALPLAFLLLLLAQNLIFIRERMELHNILGEAVFQTVAAAEKANAAGQDAVVINFPSWLAPPAVYAVGHEGVLFWPDYVPHRMMAEVHTGRPAALRFARVEAIRPEMPYFYGLTGPPPAWDELRQAPSRLFLADYAPERVSIRPIGRMGEATPETTPLAEFQVDGKTAVSLLDAAVRPDRDRGGVAVTLTWRVKHPLPGVTVFLHLLDEDGRLAAQADGDPLGGAYPLSIWEAGEAATEIRYGEIDAARVLVGLYRRDTGERVTAVSPAGVPYPDNAVPLPAPQE
jgi:hypothetical protein